MVIIVVIEITRLIIVMKNIVVLVHDDISNSHSNDNSGCLYTKVHIPTVGRKYHRPQTYLRSMLVSISA